MTPLRIAFDMDGTLADLGSAFTAIEEQLFGLADEEDEQPAPEEREAEQKAEEGDSSDAPKPRSERRVIRTGSRHRDRVWRTIEAVPDFWTTLKPLEDGAVPRLYQLTEELNWEVFFITQRPATAGGTVQWQTHKWLVDHGFKMPSVIPLSVGRGKAASALKLDYLVDDMPHNCMDVLSDSSTRPILVVPDDLAAENSARRLGIGVAHSVHEVLDLLTRATEARANPTLFEKLRKIVGWK